MFATLNTLSRRSPDPLVDLGPEGDGSSRHGGGSRESELDLLRENRRLRKELERETQRADAAESSTKNILLHARAQTAERQEEPDRGFMEQIANLKLENQRLQTELEDARSHIFSLQSYRKEITPEDVGQVNQIMPMRD